MAIHLPKKTKNSLACIDLTSAPREWLFVAMDISPFFDNVEFYDVAPTRRSVPADFSLAERTDAGTLVRIVQGGRLSPPLRYWLQPNDEQGYPNEHYILFQAIWELTEEKKRSPQFGEIIERFRTRFVEVCDKSLINSRIRKPTGARHTGPSLGTRIERFARMGTSDLMRKISRYLTDVQQYGLFEEAERFKLTDKGLTLAKALFSPSNTENDAK